MAVVLSLVKTSNKETVSILRVLLDQAIAGKVVAVAVAFRSTADRADRFALSGVYKARPGAAINAATLMKWKLTMAQDSSFSP